MQTRPHPWQSRTSPVALAVILFLVLGGLSACSGDAAAKPLPTATSGAIQISISQLQFTEIDPIGVTVTNTSQNTYYALTGRSGCTFLQMQELDSAKNTWVSVLGCSGANPMPLAISPQLTEPFTLAPASADNQNAWDPGTYRVALPFSASSDGITSPLVAFSDAFTIVSG